MNSTKFRRIGAVAGAAAFTTVITITCSTAPATAKVDEVDQDRPCFMIRSNWNNAEGPQPTCPKGRFQKTSSDQEGASQPTSSARIVDFMP